MTNSDFAACFFCFYLPDLPAFGVGFGVALTYSCCFDCFGFVDVGSAFAGVSMFSNRLNVFNLFACFSEVNI